MKKKKDNVISPFSQTDDLEELREMLDGVEEAEVPLDEILAEYSDRQDRFRRRAENQDVQPVKLRPVSEPEERPKKRSKGRVVQFPPEEERPEVLPEPVSRPVRPRREAASAEGGKDQEEAETPAEKPRKAPSRLDTDKVISLWEEEKKENPVKTGIGKLFRQADDYADSMFAEEGKEDPEGDIAEQYIPGTDEEEEPPPEKKRWKRPQPRPAPPPPPDLPAADLAKKYTRGLNSLRLRMCGVFLLAAVMLYLSLAAQRGLFLPGFLMIGSWVPPLAVTAGLALCVLLSMDVMARALAGPFRRQMGMDTVASIGVLVTLGQGCWEVYRWGGEGELPLGYGGLSALILYFCCLGEYKRRKGLRQTCKTAASASEPYLVTRDEAKWNGRGTFCKHGGEPVGFGSQVQQMDGAQKIYRRTAPVILVASVVLAALASVGKGEPGLFVWCLSVILTAASPLGAAMAFGKPFEKLTRRLNRSGAALAGWPGIEAMAGSSGILITDTDLFPPGSVTPNGIKIFGDFSVEKVVSYTASLIRDSGSGLDKIFHDLLRTQGAIYRRTTDFCCYEGGGLSAVIRGQQVLVGSASFMALMEVGLPQGLNVKNAVFCAIEGELAGIFALNYTLPASVRPSLAALIAGKVSPVLATRDFNIIPAMLRQRFKLPVEKMEFPPVERRMELSSVVQEYDPLVTAVLCREGLSPFADAVVGGRRLGRITRFNAVLASLGALAGVLLGFYLTYVRAFASLEVLNLLIFLVMWLVPVFITSANVDKY